MAGETNITIIGNLVDDPELRFTGSGVAVANFRVASTPRTFDRQANRVEGRRVAVPVLLGVGGSTPENVAESLTRAPASSSPGGSSSAPTRPRTASGAPCSRSRSTSRSPALASATGNASARWNNPATARPSGRTAMSVRRRVDAHLGSQPQDPPPSDVDIVQPETRWTDNYGQSPRRGTTPRKT